jgi:hypothetical protein
MSWFKKRKKVEVEPDEVTPDEKELEVPAMGFGEPKLVHCDICDNDGMVDCCFCKGKGKRNGKTCEYCHGEGKLKCTTCFGKKEYWI